jgi:Protein of unknown function (DUF4231)
MTDSVPPKTPRSSTARASTAKASAAKAPSAAEPAATETADTTPTTTIIGSTATLPISDPLPPLWPTTPNGAAPSSNAASSDAGPSPSGPSPTGPSPAGPSPVASHPGGPYPPLPAAGGAAVAPDPASIVEQRAADLFTWYNDHAEYSRLWYLTVKVIQLVLAAGVPVAASVHAPVGLTGSLGAAIVVLEGAQQLFQWHDNWIRYRTTASALASQRMLYETRAADYASATSPSALLATRVEGLAAAETASWAKASAAPAPGGATG